MPMSDDFTRRFTPLLPAVAQHFGTPFHIYDLCGVHETSTAFNYAFRDIEFREYFSVKAQPNPVMLRHLAEHGFGFDCSSPAELAAATTAGASGEDIAFTSNNTSREELAEAVRLGAIITVDDETVLDKLLEMRLRPTTLCLRVHPGAAAVVQDMHLGGANSAKFGIRLDRLAAVAAKATQVRAATYGLHIMLGSHLQRVDQFLSNLDLLLRQSLLLRSTSGFRVDVLNLGGGIGIPYRPEQERFDLPLLADGIHQRLRAFEQRHHWPLRVLFECGRYMLGPHGVLVTRVLNRMSKWREMVGVDSGMNALIRPGMYPDAYHHITVHDGEGRPTETVDVVGSMCENNDKLAIARTLPRTVEGDLLMVHDTGAHALSQAYTYNGRLRPQELLLHTDGSVERIRRAETVSDYLATLNCDADQLYPEMAAR
ncbi:diaminopimelate decarboxylase [Nocardia callitridis]|uniref:Diaminopimelate decarboxylase n=1 Tax=Nocardia callitridis TaxID=648753 RepID=A0ABP9K7X8_9NOCA